MSYREGNFNAIVNEILVDTSDFEGIMIFQEIIKILEGHSRTFGLIHIESAPTDEQDRMIKQDMVSALINEVVESPHWGQFYDEEQKAIVLHRVHKEEPHE